MATTPRINTLLRSVGSRHLNIPMQLGWLDAREPGTAGPHCWSVRDMATVQLLGRWRPEDPTDKIGPRPMGSIAGQLVKNGVLSEIVTWHVDVNGFNRPELPCLIKLPEGNHWLDYAQVGDVLWLVREGQYGLIRSLDPQGDIMSLKLTVLSSVMLHEIQTSTWECDRNGFKPEIGAQLVYPFVERGPTPAVLGPPQWAVEQTEARIQAHTGFLQPNTLDDIIHRVQHLEEGEAKLADIVQNLVQQMAPPDVAAREPMDDDTYEVVVTFERPYTKDWDRLHVDAVKATEDPAILLRNQFMHELQELYEPGAADRALLGGFRVESITMPRRTVT